MGPPTTNTVPSEGGRTTKEMLVIPLKANIGWPSGYVNAPNDASESTKSFSEIER